MICAEGARNHGLLNVDTKGFFDEVTIDLPKSIEEQKKIDETYAKKYNKQFIDNKIEATPKIYNLEDETFVTEISQNILSKRVLRICPLLDGGFVVAFEIGTNGLVQVDPSFSSSIINFSRRNIVGDIKASKNTNKFFTFDNKTKITVWEY